jgi:hypothetical protein
LDERGVIVYRSTRAIIGFEHPYQIYKHFRQTASAEEIITTFLDKFYYAYEGGLLVRGTPFPDTLFTLGIVVRTESLNVEYVPVNLPTGLQNGEDFFHRGTFSNTGPQIVEYSREDLIKRWSKGFLGEDIVLERVKLEMRTRILSYLVKACKRVRVYSHTTLSLGNSLQHNSEREEMADILTIGVYLTLMKDGEIGTETLSYTLCSLLYDRYPGASQRSLTHSFIFSVNLLSTITIMCLKKANVLTTVQRVYTVSLFLKAITEDKILMRKLGHKTKDFGNSYSKYVFTFQLDNLLVRAPLQNNAQIIERINTSV